MMENALHVLTLTIGWVLCILVAALGALILRDIYTEKIDLSQLVSEPSGDASMSRFQFMVFTFVIALSFFLVVAALIASNKPGFPDVPGTVLTLLGISGSSYLVSKGIQFSDPAGMVSSQAPDITISPTRISVGFGKQQQFNTLVPRKSDAKVKYLVAAGYGKIDDNGLYSAPPDRPPDAPPGALHATIQVTTDAFPDASDVAVVTLC
jgi:hypothetical protein